MSDELPLIIEAEQLQQHLNDDRILVVDLSQPGKR